MPTAPANDQLFERKGRRDPLKTLHDLASDVAALHIRIQSVVADPTCRWAQPDALRVASRLSKRVLVRLDRLEAALRRKR